MKIKSLSCKGVEDSDIANLNRVNIHTTEQILTYADLEALSRISTVPLKKLKLLRKFIIGEFAPIPETASQLLSKYSNNLIILKFGCHEIDDLVTGGLYSGDITEITGISGKCFSIFLLRMLKFFNLFE